jgi:gamma-glutamyltranspeptidase/glutathione hydrolase
MKRTRCLAAAIVAPLLAWVAAGWAASPPPLRARHGMVVSVEEQASQAGVQVLKQGGNAVDAAIATALALAVTHPSAGNIGGGGFLLIRLADGHVTFIDFRERAPAGASRDMYLDASGKVIPEASTVGPRAAGVPGTVAGLEYASRKYGKLRWRRVVEPAVRLAARGFPVSYELAHSLSSKGTVRLLERFPESKRILLRGGRYYEPGERLLQPDLARTLRRIQRGGAREFYQGETARRLAAFMQKSGGLITLADLEDYKAVERAPLTGAYRSYQVISSPPPSSGGTVLIEMLNILEGVPLAEKGAQSADAIHWTTEAMRRAFADRARYLGDPDFVKVPVRGLIDKKYAERLRASIDPQHASRSDAVAAGDPLPYEAAETTHLSVVDKDGNAAALTYTLNGGYGCGVTAEGLGFLLNNEMDDFSSKPGVPNMYGLLQGEANAIAPRKRPLSAMTPTFVTRDGKLLLVTGSPGGPTIINTVLNILLNVIDYKMGVQQAVDAPRFHNQWLPDELRVEPGFSPDTLALLKARGPNVGPARGFPGDAPYIAVAPDGLLLGAADPRMGGQAAGY